MIRKARKRTVLPMSVRPGFDQMEDARLTASSLPSLSCQLTAAGVRALTPARLCPAY